MEMPKEPMALSKYLDCHFTCSCGREHYAQLKDVRIGKDALLDVPCIAAKQGFHSLCWGRSVCRR